MMIRFSVESSLLTPKKEHGPYSLSEDIAEQGHHY